jgi:uroporphyrinogen-III synthase
VARDPAPFFEQRGASFSRVVAYEAEAFASLPVGAAELLGGERPLAAAFLSARNLRLFAQLAGSAPQRLTAFCFSEAIAARAEKLTLFDKVLRSDRRGAAGFVDFISSRCT